jgi:(E)-4-hydroxy-3-methylbut-2-enyl-diphosphate synthase
MNDVAAPLARHKTTPVRVGDVTVGGGAPVVVQSMTNTDTADVEATVRQVAALARAGSELVRITVDRNEAAAAVPHIKERLLKMGVTAPIVGDFHYIGHKLLAEHPACAKALDKYRINPGNVGFKEKKDRQFGAIIGRSSTRRFARRHRGSLDQELLTHLMDERQAPEPADVRGDPRGDGGAGRSRPGGRDGHAALAHHPSAKVSAVQDLIAVYIDSRGADYAIHLGSRRAWARRASSPPPPPWASCCSRALATPWVSLTRCRAATARWRSRSPRSCFRPWASHLVPLVAACPGCGRTTSTTFQELARRSRFHPRLHAGMEDALSRVEGLNVAVMGCIVNGPANPSTPTSASRCLAREQPTVRCSSTARRR